MAGPSRPDRGPGGGPELSTLIGLGVTTAALLVVGLGLGWLADAATDTFPMFTLVGLALGIAACCTYLYVQFRKFLKE